MREGKFQPWNALTLPVVLLLLVSCGDSSEPQDSKEMVRPVKMLTVTTDDGEQTSRYPAVIEASQIAELSFPIGGVLQELKVVEAQTVEAGQVIAQLDSRDFQSSLAQAKANFEKAEQEYQRALRLQKENAIATSVVEQRKSQREVTKSQFDSAQKALEDAVLKAPFSGVVAVVAVEQATTVSGGQTIATLFSGAGFEAVIDLPADYIAKARSRTDNSAALMLAAASGEKIPLQFKEASLLADPSSQTYKVRFTFAPPEKLVVLPGMNGTVELTSRSLEGGDGMVAVPLSSVLSDGESRYVWVIDPETMVTSKRQVTIRDGIGETVVITEGLKAGETIAGAGASYLAEGMKVRPWSMTP
ncbi:MAG: efflux RND transporter periplasmic adaptor subunit [Acidobacteriota bacterium]|nr:efflux RND transporter periplasmic adaptor subunit [Acidobacteriota bacterium]